MNVIWITDTFLNQTHLLKSYVALKIMKRVIPIDYIKLFFLRNVLEHITHHTNCFALTIKFFYVLFCVLYRMGIDVSSHSESTLTLNQKLNKCASNSSPNLKKITYLVKLFTKGISKPLSCLENCRWKHILKNYIFMAIDNAGMTLFLLIAEYLGVISVLVFFICSNWS